MIREGETALTGGLKTGHMHNIRRESSSAGRNESGMRDENQDHAALGEGVDGDIHRFGAHRQHPYLRQMQPHGHDIACSGTLNHPAPHVFAQAQFARA